MNCVVIDCGSGSFEKSFQPLIDHNAFECQRSTEPDEGSTMYWFTGNCKNPSNKHPYDTKVPNFGSCVCNPIRRCVRSERIPPSVDGFVERVNCRGQGQRHQDDVSN